MVIGTRRGLDWGEEVDHARATIDGLLHLLQTHAPAFRSITLGLPLLGPHTRRGHLRGCDRIPPDGIRDATQIELRWSHARILVTAVGVAFISLAQAW